MNWQLITILNTTYKIFLKALHKQLQPLLVEVIDSDQTAFLHFRYILLMHESIQWVKEFRQDSILLNTVLTKHVIELIDDLCFML